MVSIEPFILIPHLAPPLDTLAGLAPNGAVNTIKSLTLLASINVLAPAVPSCILEPVSFVAITVNVALGIVVPIPTFAPEKTK